jgi:hypothetical protein
LLGKSHPDVGQSLTQLAMLMPSEQGVAYLRRALEIALSNHAGDHPDVASALANVAYVAGSSQGETAEAESLLIQALEMNRRLWGDRHPRTAVPMVMLAHFYGWQSRFAEAESLLQSALEIKLSSVANSFSASDHFSSRSSGTKDFKRIEPQQRYPLSGEAARGGTLAVALFKPMYLFAGEGRGRMDISGNHSDPTARRMAR